MIEELEVKSFKSPDKTVTFDNGQAKSVQFEDGTFWLYRLDPGWKSSRDNTPELGTENCPSPHRWYMLGGKMTVEMDDGARETLEEGDVALIPPGHDAWTEGNEPVIAFEEVTEQ